MTTRLDRLRQVRERLERGDFADDRNLLSACLPGWKVLESRGDGTGPHRVRVLDPTGEGQWVDDLLESERGALWLAKQALPECSVEMIFQAGRLDDHHWCRVFFGDEEEEAEGHAPTLPIAICRAVVAALIAQAEREGAQG